MTKLIFIILTAILALSALAQDIDQKPFYLPNTDIDVKSYSVDLSILKLDGNSPIEAKVLIKLNALKDLETIKLHSAKGSVVIKEARVNGVISSTNFINDYVLEIEAKVYKQEPVEIELSYVITTAQLLNAKRRGLFSADGAISVENWPYNTRSWIPSNDAPSDTATFEIKVSVPAGIKVMSNGLLVSENNNTFHWKIKNSIPTYGLNLVVGNYTEMSSKICMDTTTISNSIDACSGKFDLSLPISLYMPTPLAGSIMERHWANVNKEARSVAFFSSILGPYEFEKVGFIHARQSFNMEYPSLITGLGANVHELAHHWFGDSVFIEHWGDLWISEGFTTYLDGLYSEVFLGKDNEKWMKVPNDQFNFPERTDPYSIFDDRPYEIGASAVHALRTKVRSTCQLAQGSPEDRTMVYGILRSIYQEFKGKRLSTQKLVSYLNKSLEETIKNSSPCHLSSAESKALVEQWSKVWFK